MEIKSLHIKIKMLLVFAAALLLYTCKKSSVNPSVNLPVVQAYLIPGHVLTVKVYQQKSLTDTAQYGEPIKGLSLFVSDGTTNAALTESAAGTYTYSDLGFLVTGKTYTLQFKYLGSTVSAKTTMPAKPVDFAVSDTAINLGTASTGPSATPDTLSKLTWSNPDSLNYIAVFKNADYTSFPINSNRFGATTSNINASNFELNTDRKSVLYLTQQSFQYYGDYQVILMSVNAEYINLLTSSSNKTTSADLIGTPTNVSNGYGIFTAMQADTLKIDVYY